MEVWRDILGYKALYSVSNLGRVKRLSRLTRNGHGEYELPEQIRKLSPGNHGYLRVTLTRDRTKKTYLAHRLVYEAFNGETEFQIDHDNDDKSCNELWNLKPLTSLDNTRKAWKTGAIKNEMMVRERTRILNELQVRIIKHLLFWGISQEWIGGVFGVHRKTICDINLRKTWAYV